MASSAQAHPNPSINAATFSLTKSLPANQQLISLNSDLQLGAIRLSCATGSSGCGDFICDSMLTFLSLLEMESMVLRREIGVWGNNLIMGEVLMADQAEEVSPIVGCLHNRVTSPSCFDRVFEIIYVT